MIGHGPALTHLADFVNGYGFTGDDLDGDGIPVVRIQHLLDPSVEMDRTDLDVPQVAIQPGDLVFSWSATLAARIWDREPALLNQHLFRVDPHSGVDRRWLKYVLDVAVDALSGHMHGSAMTHITRDMMRRVRVPFRSLQMQRAIADYLDTETARIDALIAKKRRMIELLEEAHRASVTLAIAPGGTWGDGHAGKADLPQGWDRPRFGSVVSVAEGQVDPRIEPWRSMLLIAPNHVKSGTGELIERQSAVEQGAISGKYVCETGDVIYSKIRPALRKAVLAPGRCLCSADMYPLRSSRALRPRYLHYLVLSDPFTELAVLESDRVAMPKVNRDALSRIRINLPPIAEQDRLVGVLDTASQRTHTTIESLSCQVELLAEHRQALITAAVTGELEIPAAA